MQEKLQFYLWLFGVALVGGILGYLGDEKDKSLTRAQKLRVFIVGVIGSMFTAYITFFIAFHFIPNQELCVAIAGLAAWSGTDLLLALEKKLKKMIEDFNN